jgi:hypothetical protein
MTFAKRFIWLGVIAWSSGIQVSRNTFFHRAQHVRFGSEADMCAAISDVRFTPNSDRESGLPQKVMSALPPKADMCGATMDVRLGPIAGIHKFGYRQKKNPGHCPGLSCFQTSEQHVMR